MPASAEHLAPPPAGAAAPHHVSFSPRGDADAAHHPPSVLEPEGSAARVPHSRPSSTSGSTAETRRRATARAPASDSSAASPDGPRSSTTAEKPAKRSDPDDGGTGKQRRRRFTLPPQVAWIVPVVTSWAKMKHLIRSSIIAWICTLCMVIPAIEARLGNASFLILLSAFIQPAEIPLVAVIERELFTLGLQLLAWAWSCLGIKLASLARSRILSPSDVPLASVFSGEYVEAGPSVICGAFLSIGAATCLYLKVKFGPSPFLFASILACICLDINLAYAALFPYPYYKLAEQIVLPLALKAAISIFVSMVFFPKSVNSLFVERLIAVLSPLSLAARDQIELLQESPLSPDFNFMRVHELVARSEGSLLPLQASARLLTRELSFGLASGAELSELVLLTRRLMNPSDGWAYFFSIVRADLKHDRFPHTPLPSRGGTPVASPMATPSPSRPPSPTGGSRSHLQAKSNDAEQHMGALARHFPHLFPSSRPHSPGSDHDSHHSHSRWHLHLPRHHEPAPVGTWESLRFSALESRLHRKEYDVHTETCMRILGETSRNILAAQADSLDHVIAWLAALNHERLSLLRRRVFGGGKTAFDGEKLKSTRLVMEHLEQELAEFRRTHAIVAPFERSLDADCPPDKRIPHRYLFQAYVHAFHTKRFTMRLLALLKVIADVEDQRSEKGGRFHLPQLPRLFTAETWRAMGEPSADSTQHDDEPQEIAYSAPLVSSLGSTRRRDPDALEPENVVQEIGSRVSHWLHRLQGPTAAFVVKAAMTTALLTLPSYLQQTAGFMYREKAVWAIFQAQLCLARHRGEVAFGFVSRMMATLVGATLGLLLWTIASGGNNVANPYAVMGTVAVGYPCLMLLRLHLPGPPITAIILSITSALVMGYSLKDSINPTFGFSGTGWEVAWRRFVATAIGTGAAVIVSILPPSSTLRRYQRTAHAAIINELCQLFADLISFAASSHSDEAVPRELHTKLLATRSKLRRIGLLRAVVSYEFSLRGRWPTKRYDTLAATEMEISKLLSHAVVVSEELGPAYSAALLRRTRGLDPLFLGDVIAVLQMCSTALQTGEPLPQVTPVLVERLLLVAQGGFAISRGDEDEDFGLPRLITPDVLKEPQYQAFSVGVSVMMGLVLRFDRLVNATKALVGERYPITLDFNRAHAYRPTEYS